MRILVLSPFLPYPADNGSKIRVLSFLKSLKENEVFLMVFREGKEDIFEKELRELCSEFYVFERPSISKLQFFLNHFSLKPLLTKRFYLKSLKEKIKNIIREKNIQIVIAEALLMAEYLRSLKGVYKILNAHNIEFIRAMRRIHTTKNWAKKIYYFLIFQRLKMYETKIMKETDFVIVCSSKDKEIIDKFLPKEKSIVIPNSIDTTYFTPAKTEYNPKKIVFTGTMWYEPNVDAMFYFVNEIFPLLKKRVPDLEFYIVGNRPPAGIQNLQNLKGVHVVGYVDDIKAFISGASVFVAPLRMGSGTRFKILTAMAMELPVVSTSIGCEGLDVIDGVNICIADEPDIFCEKVVKFIEDKDYRNLIGKEGRRLVVKKYSFEVTKKELNNLLFEIRKKIEC